jgi:hypothetical protein
MRKEISNETRMRISKSIEKLWSDFGYREKMRQSHKGHKDSEETKKKRI